MGSGGVIHPELTNNMDGVVKANVVVQVLETLHLYWLLFIAMLVVLILNTDVVAPEYGKLLEISFHVFPLSVLICHW